MDIHYIRKDSAVHSISIGMARNMLVTPSYLFKLRNFTRVLGFTVCLKRLLEFTKLLRPRKSKNNADFHDHVKDNRTKMCIIKRSYKGNQIPSFIIVNEICFILFFHFLNILCIRSHFNRLTLHLFIRKWCLKPTKIWRFALHVSLSQYLKGLENAQWR